MSEPFSIRIRVRGYELDAQGHLNQAVYMQYGEHARWEFLQAAGFTQESLRAAGLGPVMLKASIKFQRELRAGDEVDVSCAFEWGPRSGKLVQIAQRFHLPDGTPVAKLDGVIGVLDLDTRKLIPDPHSRLMALATSPHVL